MDDIAFDFFASPDNYRRAALLTRALEEFNKAVEESFLAALERAIRSEMGSGLADWVVRRSRDGKELSLGLFRDDYAVTFGFDGEETLIGSDEHWLGVSRRRKGLPPSLNRDVFESIRKHFRAGKCPDSDSDQWWVQYEELEGWPLLGGREGLQPLIGKDAENLAQRIARRLVDVAESMDGLLRSQP